MLRSNDWHKIKNALNDLPFDVATQAGRTWVLGAICTVGMLAVGSFFLFYYPLETIIVLLFIGSVFSMTRA